ncbi:phage tail protein [Lactiplantibacillus plantarum]|uniref:phage baseplate protein n=1 Tax=Lactiplantibacillus plantarum TaxID=1590 RepID=UPI00295BA36A|nr:hypothetical protein [Lactiplantibacillus plantarum]MDV9115393.1 hypothetical protein [Lactiplantibacillus plantarum]
MRTITIYDNSLNETASYTLDNHGIPYFGHTYTCQIEDTDNGRLWEDSNTFSVLNKYRPASTPTSACFFDWIGPDNRIYRYRITDITDYSGQAANGLLPYTTFTGANKLAFDLAGISIEDKTWISPTLKEVAEYVLGGTGWEIGEFDELGLTTDSPTNFAISGASNAQDAFSTMISSFSCEVRAYIEVDMYGNQKQVVDIVKNLEPVVNSNFATLTDQSTNLYTDPTLANSQYTGDPTQGRTIEYRAGLAGFQRAQNWQALYTRIYPISQNGATIQAVNNNSPYVYDTDAQAYWLGSGQPYRTLKITNENIGNLSGLKSWAQSQLKIYNHPEFTYTITTAFMRPEDMPMLGTTNYIANFDVEPTLTILAEVIQVEIHDDAPASNVITYGEYRTLNPTSPALIDQLRSSISSAIAKAKKDASSIKPVALTPDGNNFTDTTQTKRLILQAWEGSTNISSYIDNKGFIWRRYNTDGTVDTSYQQTGYLINAASNAVGTLHGTIEADYIQDDPEIKLDTTGISYLGVYGPDDNGAHSATQYMARLSNGQYLTSRARDDSGSSDTMFALQDSKFAVQSVMLQIHGQHGGTFGVQEVDDTVYIWSIVSLKNDGSYILVRFPYVAGLTLQPTDKRVQQVMPLKGYGRINYDRQHDMVSIGYSDGSTDILKASDLLAGNYNVLYNFNITDYGIDFNQNTYQSECLDFPYFYFAAGGGEAETTNDPHKVWALNVVHKGAEFEAYFDNDMVMPNLTDESREVETCNVFYQGTQAYLLVTFNTRVLEIDPYSAEKEKVYTIPITKRPVASVIDKGTINENDSTAD